MRFALMFCVALLSSACVQIATAARTAPAAPSSSAADGSAGTLLTPPATPRHAAATTLHGVKVSDPYRWLEDADAPAVQAWIKAQNAYTEKVIGAMPEGPAISKRVKALAISSTTRSSPRLAGGTLFYLRETPPQPQPVLVAQPWPNGSPRVLVDLNKDHGRVAITAYWPSPSGHYLAYGTATGGSELTTIHVLDVKTGKLLDDALPWAGGGTTPQALAWDAGETGFVYVRFPPPAKDAAVKQFNAALVHHTLGQPATQDQVVFGSDYSRIAEYRLLVSPGAKHVAVLANAGDGGPADVFMRRSGQWHKVLGAKANVRGAAWVGERLLVASFAHAPRGKILAVTVDGSVSKLLAQSGDGALQGIAPVDDGFLVIRSWGPDWRIDQYDAKAHWVRRVALPKTDIGIGGIASEYGRANALISYSGWTLPPRWARYDSASGKLETIFKVKPAGDYSKVAVHRIDGVSKDGSPIPVTVLALKGVTANGKRPTILYGYGGFDIPLAPHFIGARLAWLERGGAYAVANIRGGNEYGERWHRQGMQLHKQNVFDDFYAAAQALEKAHWTDRDYLGIMGGSNGGLLMGAELTQHPDAFRAVVSNVGIYDMIRHETNFANGQYNVPEYGSVDDAAQFKATLKYSPLQNVTPKTAYPALLMTTGANDPRVAPWQSRKFTAALQAANTSPQPILLLTRMHAGHGIGAPFSQRVGNTVLALTFFAHELGLPSAP